MDKLYQELQIVERLIIRKTLDLVNPLLANQWHPTKNILIPSEITTGSNKKVWWQCDKGHEWQARVNSRNAGSGCPVCSGKVVLPGYNDLFTINPVLAKEYSSSLNVLPVTLVQPQANKKVWWQCEKGHEWEAIVASRSRGNGCPYCAGKIAVTGINDLTTLDPELSMQWHPTKNIDINLQSVTAQSNKKVWWQDKFGHEWQAKISDRHLGNGCPYCSGRLRVAGQNDLLTSHPLISAQWHAEKNVGISIELQSAYSNKKVWWRCEKGHEWQTWVYARVAGNGCPTCSAGRNISQPQREIQNFLEEFAVRVIPNDRAALNGIELDLFLPDYSFAIEYNGLYWHSEAKLDKNYHFKKNEKAKSVGIRLVQIWEDQWLNQQEIVKAMLLHKLKLTSAENIGARKTEVQELNHQTATEFLTKYHFQGGATGKWYLGLITAKNDLVAVMVLKSQQQDLLIERYATSLVLPGGFTKLLKYAERKYRPKKFITFSDNMISDGSLYRANGFIADKELAPDYMYINRNKREHKFNYRLKRFKSDASLTWAEGLSESQLAALNGLNRIWDAGKTRWVRSL